MKYLSARLLVLSVFPVLFGYYLWQYKNAQGPLYLGYDPDPSYVYLFNSVNLAYGKAPGHVDHPGTTVQYLGTISSSITYLFTGNKPTLAEDVISNPEKYLKVFCTSIIFLNVLCSFFLGLVATKHTSNISVGIYFQMIPLMFLPVGNQNVVKISAEALVWVFTSVTTLLCLIYYVKEKEFANSTKFIFSFAVVAVLGFITKITLLPLGLLPLFFISRNQGRIYYVIVSILLFILIALPALFSYEYLFTWIKGLFINSGHYGAGESNFIDTAKFRLNINMMYESYKFIFVLIALILLLPLLALWRKKIFNMKIIKCFAAFVMVNVLYIFLISKHYDPRYMIPMLTFDLGFAAIFFLWLAETFKGRYLVVIVSFLAFLRVGFSINDYDKEIAMRQNYEKNYTATYKKLQEYKNDIILYYYPGSSIEYGLIFGSHLCREMTPFYYHYLDKQFPNVIHYNSNSFWCDIWRKQTPIKDILAQNKRVILYGGGELPQKINIKNSDNDVKEYSTKLLFDNSSGIYIRQLIP